MSTFDGAVLVARSVTRALLSAARRLRAGRVAQGEPDAEMSAASSSTGASNAMEQDRAGSHSAGRYVARAALRAAKAARGATLTPLTPKGNDSDSPAPLARALRARALVAAFPAARELDHPRNQAARELW